MEIERGERAWRVRCRLTLLLLQLLLTSGCVSDAVSGPHTGRSRRGRSSTRAARVAVPRPRGHGVTMYYNDVCAADAATDAAAQPPTTLFAAAETATAAAPNRSPSDGRPRRSLIVRSPIGRSPR